MIVKQKETKSRFLKVYVRNLENKCEKCAPSPYRINPIFFVFQFCASRDHARGNAALVKEIPGLKVYGADDRIEGLTDKVTDSQELKFNSINVKCLFTPCHTAGDMCYYVWEDECTDAPAVFTGDTLFVGGCGRFCEGTAEQMHHNLTKVLASLPQETKVFCGHENTIKNLKFAMLVEPENEKVKEMLSWARARDDDDKPTVPSTLREEFDYNPFLRLS
uniref:Hydroxyacylglutathione hydrolase like n=1 Tax=Fundulus heteroclitus TaxID=8078 RepID=A0A3Q2Q2Y6_FUNHE